MHFENKYTIIFVVAVCANVVNTGKLYMLKVIIDDSDNDIQNELSYTKQRSAEDEEMGLTRSSQESHFLSSKGKKRVKIRFMPEKHNPEFIKKILEVVRKYYSKKKARPRGKKKCNRHFGSIYGTKSQYLNCLKDLKRKEQIMRETNSEPLTSSKSLISNSEYDILKFIDVTRSQEINELAESAHIRKKLKEYTHYPKRLQTDSVLFNYLTSFANNKHNFFSDFSKLNNRHRKLSNTVRFSMDYYDDSNSGRKFYTGRSNNKLDFLVRAPSDASETELEDVNKEIIKNEDRATEEVLDARDAIIGMPKTVNHRPFQKPSQTWSTNTSEKKEKRKRKQRKSNNISLKTKEENTSDYQFSKEDTEDENKTTEESNTPLSKTIEDELAESKTSEESGSDNKVPLRETSIKESSEFVPTNRFEIVDRKIAPIKNKILIHSDSSEDSVNKEEDESLVLNEPKKKAKSSGKVYIYMQGPHRLIKIFEEETGRRSSNQRLEHFLPKKSFWDEDEFNDLGYFWFNGPQGRFQGPWKAPYR